MEFELVWLFMKFEWKIEKMVVFGEHELDDDFDIGVIIWYLLLI